MWDLFIFEICCKIIFCAINNKIVRLCSWELEAVWFHSHDNYFIFSKRPRAEKQPEEEAPKEGEENEKKDEQEDDEDDKHDQVRFSIQFNSKDNLYSAPLWIVSIARVLVLIPDRDLC